MGFQHWVPQEDTNTEIRVAVLLSLVLQTALIFLGPMRKRSSSPRFVIWSCYLLADWVADLALGLLLNTLGNIGGSSSLGINHADSGGKSNGNINSSSGSPMIFVFWTPFLLLHLGGPDTITAYSVEDNELWLRHLIGLFFELFSAAVIFICSLRGNPMIGATVLMFVAGIIKYGERTYSLYSGSIKSFRANILDPKNRDPHYLRLKSALEIQNSIGIIIEVYDGDQPGGASKKQKDAVRSDIEELQSSGVNKHLEALAYDFFVIFRRLFVDLTLNTKQRKMSQTLFLEYKDMDVGMAFQIIELELDLIYDMVYTKAPVAYTLVGWVLRSICSGCIVAATVIFFFHDKRGIKRVDVRITYALLMGGLALDVAALIMLLFSNRASAFFHKSRWFKWLDRLTMKLLRRKGRRWAQSVSQFNLLNYASGKPYNYNRCFLLLKVAKTLHVLEDFIYIRREPLRKYIWRDHGAETDILILAFNSVRSAAGDLGDDELDKTVEVFNCRGSRALRSHEDAIKTCLSASSEEQEDVDKIFEMIMDSVVKVTDFDESLLLWHIATDLCLTQQKHHRHPPSRDANWKQNFAKTLSEYMMYLLIKQPEMLSTRTGTWLMRYQDTCAEASHFTKYGGDMRGKLLAVNTSRPPARPGGDDESSKSVLFDACVLANALEQVGRKDDELMWDVVVGVWVEMLIYAARECPGSTHVRELNRGGELITLIWFLIEDMGFGKR
ncbi:hypothetical protein PR202_gb12161 [Eleusine coracana subsp. coracana]|uniref:DUF4220 domain-containing protein n=1 Tax=Eleusine coracana subsp. coracana TaxID=191504 RepID=A0AAV5ENV9_ELECO|nr:hypothetical protein PR202_gb12161 [Eleusine coracana subsp. coracana]